MLVKHIEHVTGEKEHHFNVGPNVFGEGSGYSFQSPPTKDPSTNLGRGSFSLTMGRGFSPMNPPAGRGFSPSSIGPVGRARGRGRGFSAPPQGSVFTGLVSPQDAKPPSLPMAHEELRPLSLRESMHRQKRDGAQQKEKYSEVPHLSELKDKEYIIQLESKIDKVFADIKEELRSIKDALARIESSNEE